MRAVQVPWTDGGNASWISNWAWRALRSGLSSRAINMLYLTGLLNHARVDGGVWRYCCWDGQGFGLHPMERLKQTQSSVRNRFMFLGPRPGRAECIPEVLYYLVHMPFAGLREVCPSGLLSLIHPLRSFAGEKKKKGYWHVGLAWMK